MRFTFKPMTYLVSFTLFVLTFTALGAYVGYGKIADQLLTQAYLEATPLRMQVFPDPQGSILTWDERVALAQGGFVRVAASQRPPGLDIDGVASGLLLTAQERPEDLRIDAGGRYLFARLLTPARTRAEEITWLCKYDLKHRRLARRTSVNPVLLPAPFRP